MPLLLLPVPGILQLLQESIRFYRKHPVLQTVTVLFFVPFLSVLELLNRALSPSDPLFPLLRNVLLRADRTGMSLFLLPLPFALLLLWGVACVLTVARRMLFARGGRGRSSLKFLRREALPLVSPLLLTGLLRLGVALLWSLLLVIPGIVYLLRTVFFAAVIACEDRAYGAALRRSSEAVTGREWLVFGRLLLASLLLFLPWEGLRVVLETALQTSDARLLLLSDLLIATLRSISLTTFLLYLTTLYGHLRDSRAELVDRP